MNITHGPSPYSQQWSHLCCSKEGCKTLWSINSIAIFAGSILGLISVGLLPTTIMALKADDHPLSSATIAKVTGMTVAGALSCIAFAVFCFRTRCCSCENNSYQKV
jgi:hypothetical protein